MVVPADGGGGDGGGQWRCDSQIRFPAHRPPRPRRRPPPPGRPLLKLSEPSSYVRHTYIQPALFYTRDPAGPFSQNNASSEQPHIHIHSLHSHSRSGWRGASPTRSPHARNSPMARLACADARPAAGACRAWPVRGPGGWGAGMAMRMLVPGRGTAKGTHTTMRGQAGPAGSRRGLERSGGRGGGGWQRSAARPASYACAAPTLQMLPRAGRRATQACIAGAVLRKGDRMDHSHYAFLNSTWMAGDTKAGARGSTPACQQVSNTNYKRHVP